MANFLKLPIYRWLGAVGLMGSVTLVSGGATAIFPPQPILGTDKLIHFLVFGLIATSILRALPERMPDFYRMLIALVVTSLFGMSDEIHQSFTPGRTLDLYDWTADTLGALVATIVYNHWPRYRKVLEWKIRPTNSKASAG